MKRLIAAGLAAFTLTFSSWAMQHASFAQTQSAYSTERQANAGRKAERQRFVYTTEQAVVFTFGGLSKRGALEYVLDKMDEESMRGTFFVTERELERNRDNIDMIVSRGHELAIGIRVSQDADKPDDFDSICGQIERVRSILSEDYGTDTNLVREMTGSNEDFMFEAVSAMGCRLMGQSVNVVRTKDKNAKSAEEVMETLFGKGGILAHIFDLNVLGPYRGIHRIHRTGKQPDDHGHQNGNADLESAFLIHLHFHRQLRSSSA